MSQENVDQVRTGFDAFNRQDFDAVADMLDPEVEWDASEQFDGRIYRGREGFREYVADVYRYWDYWRLEIDKCHDVGDRVLVIGWVHAQNTRHQLPVKIRVAWVWTLRNLKGVHMRVYLSPDEALEAVGLSE